MNYIPHYTKKKQILARKEQDLQRLLDRGATMERLIAAANDVRDARIRVLRAQRATIPPKDDAQTMFDKIDRRITLMRNTTPQEILAEFGHSANH